MFTIKSWTKYVIQTKFGEGRFRTIWIEKLLPYIVANYLNSIKFSIGLYSFYDSLLSNFKTMTLRKPYQPHVIVSTNTLFWHQHGHDWISVPHRWTVKQLLKAVISCVSLDMFFDVWFAYTVKPLYAICFDEGIFTFLCHLLRIKHTAHGLPQYWGCFKFNWCCSNTKTLLVWFKRQSALSHRNWEGCKSTMKAEDVTDRLGTQIRLVSKEMMIL